jgi:hypothetical protein
VLPRIPYLSTATVFCVFTLPPSLLSCSAVASMELHGASWLSPTDCYHQARYASSPSDSALYATTSLLKGSETLPSLNLITLGLFVSLAALLWRFLANRKSPRCLPKKLDILVVLKALFSVVYVSGTVIMIFHAPRDSPEMFLLVATAVSAIFDLSSGTRSLTSVIDHLRRSFHIRALPFRRTQYSHVSLRYICHRGVRVPTSQDLHSPGISLR